MRSSAFAGRLRVERFTHFRAGRIRFPRLAEIVYRRRPKPPRYKTTVDNRQLIGRDWPWVQVRKSHPGGRGARTGRLVSWAARRQRARWPFGRHGDILPTETVHACLCSSWTKVSSSLARPSRKHLRSSIRVLATATSFQRVVVKHCTALQLNFSLCKPRFSIGSLHIASSTILDKGRSKTQPPRPAP